MALMTGHMFSSDDAQVSASIATLLAESIWYSKAFVEAVQLCLDPGAPHLYHSSAGTIEDVTLKESAGTLERFLRGPLIK